MSAFIDTIKRLLVRFKQNDFKFVNDNWSALRSRNIDIDISAVSLAKTKFISALLQRIKVNTVLFSVYRTLYVCVYPVCSEV